MTAAITPDDSRTFAGKRVLVGVTGGIAAYKVCTLVSRLVQAGADVTVAMTEGATRFVGPLTFASLSGKHVYTSVWESGDAGSAQDPQHIRLARELDAAIICPCSMDFAAKLCAGLGDDVVSLILSAVDRKKTPVLLAPAMNAAMWAQPATQRNMQVLRGDGFTIVGPEEGWQACRTVGAGRMSEPEALLAALRGAIAKS